MGDLEGWKGNLLEEECPPSAHPVCLTTDICNDQWAKAELRTRDLISHIQPTIDSENRRNAVVQYVQHLVSRCIRCEVFTFGSVPLKTYLPDGDIDLTAFSKHHDVNNTWASDVRSVLQEEEKREDAKFRVKDVQYIHAEVKLVKCLIENIVVDISFNQLGGLCTLCFLEQVNELIGKDNLFKRSIILVKAWCYYESRILGAHHGLISTYALETLVLYIFHIFHATVQGPLEVLFKFLDFFSKFDWDNYCLSIQGPVPKSTLPEIAAESPQTNGGNVLLSKEFLKVCSEKYSVFPKGQDNHIQTFSAKHLNIVDPLRENNNLGRSVSKANFHRIRSALGYGARTLANILQSPVEKISGELDKFFMSTWERHGYGRRPDVPELKSQDSANKPPVKSDSFMVCLRSINENGTQDGNKTALTSHCTTDIKIVENKSVDTSVEDVTSTILDDLTVLDNCREHTTEKSIEQCTQNYVSAIAQFNENCSNKASPPLEDLISGDRLACNFQKDSCDKHSVSLAGPHEHLNPFGESASELPNPHAHDTSNLGPRGHTLPDIRNNSCIIADDVSQVSGGVQCTLDAANSFDSNIRNIGSNYCNSSIECGLLEDGHAVIETRKTYNTAVTGHDNLLCSANDGNVSPSEDIETSSFVPASFVKEEVTLDTHDLPQNSVPSSVVQTYPIPYYPKQNVGNHFPYPILYGPVFADNASSFQASHRPPSSGKQASPFAFGGSGDPNVLKSFMSHHPMAEGIAFNSYAYCPPDTHNSFNPIQATMEAGGSLYKPLGNGNEVSQLEILNNQKSIKNTHTSLMQKVESKAELTSSASSPSLDRMSVGDVDGLSSSKSDLLNGDYRHHLNSLAYGRSCQDHVWTGSLLPIPVGPRYAQEHYLWEGPGRPVHSNMCMPNHVRGRGVVSSHPLHYPSAYPGVNSRIQSGIYNNEEITKPRSGTGTYIPKVIYRSNRDKHLPNKGRHQYGIPASDFTTREADGHHSRRRYASYDSDPSWELGFSNFEGNTSEENYGIGGLSRPESVYKNSYQSTSHTVMGNGVLVSPGGGMTLAMHPPSYLSAQDSSPAFTTVNTSGPPIFMAYPYASGTVQFGTFGPVPSSTVPFVRPEPGGSAKERGLQQSASPLKRDRLASRNYQLKEEDFPPLPFQGTDRGNCSATGSENSSN